MEKIDRYLGSLQGLAVGDALGTTLEFAEPGTFTPVTDMIRGGPFSLRPGEIHSHPAHCDNLNRPIF